MKPLKIALPKGNLFKSTISLLKASGIDLYVFEKNHKPQSNYENLQFFIIKPRDIPAMVEKGMVDVGFVGLDLVKDENADVKLHLDLKTMPVFLVFATNDIKRLEKNNVTIASEYLNIAKDFFSVKNKNFSYIKTSGATECFVGDFADAIVEHIQSGASLKANNLKIVDIIMKSTTHLIGNKRLGDEKREILNSLIDKLNNGIEKIDTSYPEFLTEEEIKAIIAERKQ